MRLALYQPEIPQNTGTLMRLGACLNVEIDVIEPCGFVWNDKKLLRAGMDYAELVMVQRHSSWTAFQEQLMPPQRLILLDTKATTSFLNFEFQPQDILLLGKESTGVPQEIFDQIPDKVIIPMLSCRRSLNMAVAAAMVLTEALRQTSLFPEGESL